METPHDIYARITPRGAALLKRHAISTQASVRDALRAINGLSGEAMTLFAISPEGTLAGTVTDGDIRRGLIAGVELEAPVADVMHTGFSAATPGDDYCVAIAAARRKRLSLLPVVDGGTITDIIDLNSVKTHLPIDAVLMAGGKGERLRPLTLDTPKPLLPVGGKAIIDYNVDELEACGVDNIFVTVNYLAEKIESHFGQRDGRARVACVREPRRLGTIGSLALVEGLAHDDVLLMNSDLLTDIDFEAFYIHHKKSGAAVTMAAVPYTVSVPFAIMHIDKENVTALEEKPTYNYFANAGVYLLQRRVARRITPGKYLDAPDFISSLIAEGESVGCFPIQGTWVDIGSPDDYRHANEMMDHRALRR